MRLENVLKEERRETKVFLTPSITSLLNDRRKAYKSLYRRSAKQPELLLELMVEGAKQFEESTRVMIEKVDNF